MVGSIRRLGVLALATCWVAAGCGAGTFGPVTAEAEAFVVDDNASGGTYTGTVAGNFSVSISPDSRTWIDLGSLNGITVDLQDAAGTSVHGSQPIPEATYSRVRLVVEDLEFTVDAGGTVGGIGIGGETKADLAVDGPVTIERSVPPFALGAGGRAEIRFDLQSEIWLTAADLLAGTLPLNAAATAVIVTITTS